MTFHTLRFLLAAAILGASAPGLANDDGTDHAVTVENQTRSLVLQSNGNFIATGETVLLVKDQRGVKQVAQIPYAYNRSLETLDILEAYTQKPDGRKLMVTAEQIREQQETSSANAPMFHDTLRKVVIFPDVAVGDRLVVRTRRTRSTPLFSDNFHDFLIPLPWKIEKLSVTYDVPATMTLYSDAKGFSGSVVDGSPGRKIHRWDYKPSERRRVESGSVARIDYGDYLAVTTFPDVAALARAFDSRARDKVKVTPTIAELAKSLTAGADDPRAKALRLSDWVRKNIRYVAVYVGQGGVVPHASDVVLDNRYGDCKDHVVLLEALLTAAGIDSTPALISHTNAYRLPKVAALAPFNHLITYIPSLDLYLDSTSESVAAGYLPALELDKPVVLTKSGKLARTPPTQLSRMDHNIDVTLMPDGKADFTYSRLAHGYFAEPSRYQVRSMKPADRDLWVQRLLQNLGQKGSGTVDLGKVTASGEEYELKLVGRSDDWVGLPGGPVGMFTVSSLTGGIRGAIAPLAAEKERTQPFSCFATEFNERSKISLSPAIKIISMPKPVALSSPSMEFTSDYGLDGNTITIKRQFKFKHKSAVCMPEDFKTMQPVIDGIMRDLKSQIIMQTL